MLTLLLQGCQGRQVPGWELCYRGSWGCPMPQSTSPPALWWGGQQNLLPQLDMRPFLSLALVRNIHNYTQRVLEKALWYHCTGQDSCNICFSNGSYSLRQFLKIAYCFPSPISSYLCPLNFKPNKTRSFNINSTTLLMTTKHWLRWLTHLVMLGRVCASKKNAVKHHGTLIMGLFCFRAFTSGFQGLSSMMFAMLRVSMGLTLLTSSPLHSRSFPLLSNICSQLYNN